MAAPHGTPEDQCLAAGHTASLREMTAQVKATGTMIHCLIPAMISWAREKVESEEMDSLAANSESTRTVQWGRGPASTQFNPCLPGRKDDLAET